MLQYFLRNIRWMSVLDPD